MGSNENPLLRLSEDFTEDVDALMNNACQMKMEGLIGKRSGSPSSGLTKRDLAERLWSAPCR